jgi:hypothetical protein
MFLERKQLPQNFPAKSMCHFVQEKIVKAPKNMLGLL